MSGEFPLSRLYLTPRVVKTARAAGILAFEVKTRDIRGIYSRLRQVLPDHGPKGPIEELAIVMRWAGRWATSWDVRQKGADLNQPYLPADAFATAHEGDQREWVNFATVANLSQEVVEMSVRRWDDPRFGAQLADGMLDFGAYSGNTLTAGLVYALRASLTDESLRQTIIEESQRRYPRPIGVFNPGQAVH